MGCFYRNEEVKFMSMYGSVTDAQVFSRELSVEEMVDFTTCRSVMVNTSSNHVSMVTAGLLPKETSSAGTEKLGL